MSTTLLLGDCLELMSNLPDNSVDMVLCDLPYGTTACEWDAIIPSPLYGIWSREGNGKWSLLYQYPRSYNYGQAEATLRKARQNSPKATLKIAIVPE